MALVRDCGGAVMFPSEDPMYRAQYRLRRRPITKLSSGPWEIHYDARGMQFFYGGHPVGEKVIVPIEQTSNAGSSKAAKYLIGCAARISLAKITDLHDHHPFDPMRFRDIFAWRVAIEGMAG